MLITIIQGLTFVLYLSFILIKLGLLPSISESWYQLKFPTNILFTVFCWIIGFGMFSQSNGETPFFFLAGAGLCFTGAATMFKSAGAYTNKVHSIGALICILGSFAGLIFERSCWYPLVIFISLAAFILLLKINNRIFWLEIGAFVSIILGLLLTQNK